MKINFSLVDSFFKIFKWIYDVGLYRVQKRIRYQIRLRTDQILPSKVNIFLYGFFKKTPKFILGETYILNKQKEFKNFNSETPNVLKIKLLNKKISLKWPIKWSNSEWPRLLLFNLHYFDWARKWIDESISANKKIKELNYIPELIDSWINGNTIGKGDGWHSYTISLRIRNWIWLFRFFPFFINEKRIDSLWKQLCWLESHPEDGLGGNHWLENLVSLIIGSYHFESKKAKLMRLKALFKLNKELKTQILSDGGHEERSATYHLLILERLTELGLIIEEFDKIRPIWLLDSIKNMVTWSKKIKLLNNSFPRFNDSPKDCVDSVEDIIKFAEAYINKEMLEDNNSRSFMTKIYNRKALYKSKSNAFKSESIFLKETGWMIIRLNPAWEFLFKCGESGPKHLPGHAHSDMLSFELFFDGIPIISEEGTSTYENCPKRIHQRSSQAHNTIQLGISKSNNKIKWIEPLDIFGTFYAGNKPLPLERKLEQISKDKFYISASHDGFRNKGLKHTRSIEIEIIKKNILHLKVKDQINSCHPFYWRYWNHLGPNVNLEMFDTLISQIKKKYSCGFKWQKTSFAYSFGNTKERESLCFYGKYPKGDLDLEFKYIFKKDKLFKIY